MSTFTVHGAGAGAGAGAEHHRHPYWPATAAVPGFRANETGVGGLLAVLGLLVLLVVGSALRQLDRSRAAATARPMDRVAAAWFSLCGFLHVAFEGYYLLNRQRLVALNSPFAELWKEYALCDSRYVTDDAFTVSVETLTALVWGPLCWLVFAAILADKRPRHILQVVVCTAHLYGVALYYLTSWNEVRLHGRAYSRPEFLYFWVYFVGFNLPWVVVPAILMRDSIGQINEAFGLQDEMDNLDKDE